MTGVTFAPSTPGIVEIDKANPVFEVYDDFIANYEDDSLVRYFGRESEVLIGKRSSGIGAVFAISMISPVFDSRQVLVFLGLAPTHFCAVLDCHHFRFLRRLRRLPKNVSRAAAD
jgi:hypothetical protein